MQETVGWLLCRSRTKTGLSRADMARKLGENISVVRNWENDESVPAEDKYQKIVAAYQTTDEELKASIDFNEEIRRVEAEMRFQAMRKTGKRPKTVDQLFHGGSTLRKIH